MTDLCIDKNNNFFKAQCGENQHYEVCGVNGCENTCAQPDLESVCRNIRCQEGCYCDEGYIRAPNGECVLPENCPPCKETIILSSS